MKCPKCNSKVDIEDHSSVGGSKEYWSCTECDEEMIMISLTDKGKKYVLDAEKQRGKKE